MHLRQRPVEPAVLGPPTHSAHDRRRGEAHRGEGFTSECRLAVLACLIAVTLVVASTVSAEGLNRDQRRSRAEIKRVFKANAPAALRVAWCESRWSSRAWSRTSDAGVFQINYAAHHHASESVRAFQERMFDLKRNVAFAYRLSRGGTRWRAWACRWAA